MFETYCEFDPGARHDIPFGRLVRYLTENVDTGVDVVDASNVDQFTKK
jgi:hypothetical protein